MFLPHEFNFQRKRVILDGIFYLRPRRLLKKSLKACGAIVAPSLKQAPRPDLVVQGSSPTHYLEVLTIRHGGLVIDEVMLAQSLRLIDSASERSQLLRELIYDESFDALSWRRLCYLLEFWPREDDLLQGLDYARHFVDRWSEPLRRSPARWALRVANGGHDPRLALASYIDLGLCYRLTPGRLLRLLEQLPQHATGLRLVAPNLDSLSVEKLLAHPAARRLRYLCLAGANLRGQEKILLQAQLPELEVLDLSLCSLPGAMQADLLSSRHRPKLRTVHMRSWRMLHRWNIYDPRHSRQLLETCDWAAEGQEAQAH